MSGHFSLALVEVLQMWQSCPHRPPIISPVVPPSSGQMFFLVNSQHPNSHSLQRSSLAPLPTPRPLGPTPASQQDLHPHQLVLGRLSDPADIVHILQLHGSVHCRQKSRERVSMGTRSPCPGAQALPHAGWSASALSKPSPRVLDTTGFREAQASPIVLH